MSPQGIEYQRVALDEDVEKHYSDLLPVQRPTSWAQSVPLRAILSHSLVGLLVLLATFLWPLVVSGPGTQSSKYPQLYSPVRDVITYEIDHPPFNYWSDSIYFGTPTPESEKAWDELTRIRGVQMTPEEVAYLPANETDTPVLPNGNSLYIFAAMHNLHCLRRLHRTLQGDHYYADKDEAFRKSDLYHTGHCLESIRTSLMCSPDLNLNRYYWSGRKLHDFSVRPDVTRECVNWDAIQNFMDSRPFSDAEVFEAHKARPDQALPPA